MKHKKANQSENEISEVREVTLGGYRQKILLDGRRRKNPVVLCLHGGPGTPLPFGVGCRGMFPEITEKVTLVCWDQLGCGINAMPIDDSFSIESFVGMTVDLIGLLRAEFSESPLFLLGFSWGSILALRASVRAPRLINGAVTYGQVVEKLGFNDAVYEALESSALSKKEKEKLGKIKSDPKFDDAPKLMGWIRKYTDGYFCRSGEKTPIGAMLAGFLKSPDYRLRDLKAVFVNGYAKNKSLLRELFTIDLKAELSDVRIPYTVFQGSTDLVTPTTLVKPLILGAGNERLRCVELEKSGHIPGAGALKEIVNEIERMAG